MNENAALVGNDRTKDHVWKALVSFCYKKMNENPWVQLDFLDSLDMIPKVAPTSVRRYLTDRYGSTLPAELIEIAEDTTLMSGRRDGGMNAISNYWKRWIFNYLSECFEYEGRVSMPNQISMEYNLGAKDELPSMQIVSALYIPFTIWSTDKSRRIYEKSVNIYHSYNGVWYVTVTDQTYPARSIFGRSVL